MDQRSADADKYAHQNRVIRECLENEEKLKSMNDTMARTIATEVYDFSLARALLLPRLISGGGCSPVYEEGEDGPVVMVNVVQREKRVLHCRAFRDSLREEETVETVRDVQYLAVHGRGVRPASFPLSNVCTAKLTELDRRPFSIVELARTRMRRSLAQDETRVMLRALAWVCSRFGRRSWCANPGRSLSGYLASAVRSAGLHRNPAVLCSPLTFARVLNLRIVRLTALPSEDKPSAPIAAVEVDGQTIPVYVNQAVPNHLLYVVPSGDSLGQMPIFNESRIVNYDRKERLIKGWLLWQEQGMVFVNPRATNVVFVGWRGLWGAVKSLIGWGRD